MSEPLFNKVAGLRPAPLLKKRLWHRCFLVNFVKFLRTPPMATSPTLPSGHGCISDASLRRLIQRLRDVSKRADLQISETSRWRLIRDVCSETSLRSLRFSQRRLFRPNGLSVFPLGFLDLII